MTRNIAAPDVTAQWRAATADVLASACMILAELQCGQPIPTAGMRHLVLHRGRTYATACYLVALYAEDSVSGGLDTAMARIRRDIDSVMRSLS